MPKRLVSGSFVLGMALAPSLARGAPGDTCEEAVGIDPGVVAGSTVSAPEGPATPCARGDTRAIWFRFAAPSDGRYLLTTRGSELADTTLSLYWGCGEPGAMTCVDDTDASLAAEATVDLVAGQTIWARVAGWGGTTGPFVLAADRREALLRPPNDACEDALPIDQATSAVGTTLFASGEDVTSCGSDDVADIWYTFTAEAEGDYDFFVTQNQTAANLVSVHETCGGGELSCGVLSTSAHVAAGQKVWVRVGSNPDASDSFDVHVGPGAPAIAPSNDTFATAQPVFVGDSIHGTTVGATQDAMNFGPVCAPWVNAAVWYSFVAPADGVYVFDTSASEMEDTIVAAFEACDTNGDAIPPPFLVCDDDFGRGKRARLDGFLAEGESLCIAVAGRYLSEHGSFVLDVSELGPPPANDTCEGAIPIQAGQQIEGENYAATPTPTGLACPSGAFALWYSFTAPADGLYKVDTKESADTSPEVAIYDRCGGEARDCSAELRPSVPVEMVEGQTILVRLSTDVFWRSPMVLRVGPDRAPTGEGGGPAEGGASAGGAGAGGEPASEGGSAPTLDDDQDGEDGCGCRLEGRDAGGHERAGLLVLGLLLTLGRRRPAGSASCRRRSCPSPFARSTRCSRGRRGW